MFNVEKPFELSLAKVGKLIEITQIFVTYFKYQKIIFERKTAYLAALPLLNAC